MKETAYLRLKNSCVDITENIIECNYNVGLLMDTAEVQAMNLTARRKLAGARSALQKADIFICDFIDYLGYERKLS